jgi:hypothetical protein
VPALLVLWHGIAGGRLFAREVRFFLVLGGVAVVYSLGHYTPLFELVFDYIPGVKLYRRPSDATFLINIGLAVAAGYLVHRYVRDGAPRFAGLRRRSPAAALPVLALGLLAAGIAGALVFAVKSGQLSPSLREIGFGLLLAAGAMVLAQRGAVMRWRPLAAAALVAVTGGELVWRHAASALNAEPAERYAVFRELPPEQLQGLQVLKAELALRHAKGERPRVEILGLGGAWQNASMVLKLEDTIGYNPLRLADYERAVGPGENAVDPNLRQFPATFRGYRCRLASLLGLEYLLLDRPLDKLPRHFPRLTGASLLYGSGQMWIYRLEASSPRVYLATVVSPVDSDAVLDQDELPEFDRSQEALVDEASLPLLAGSYGAAASDVGPLPAKASARIVEYSVNDVTVEVESDRAGVLVLHDLYYPGWEVTVDGESRPLLRANLLFRGVEVPAGRHRVAFGFRPLSMDNLVAAAVDLVDNDDGRDGAPPTRTQ